jgi:hypothetical protein
MINSYSPSHRVSKVNLLQMPGQSNGSRASVSNSKWFTPNKGPRQSMR